jgi:transcription-repair coupling factor (superfamily II helicase)
MILPSVSETLAAVSRHPALESVISGLRKDAARELLAGLTDTAKALVIGQVVAELRRPTIVLVASSAQAESLAASLQFFYTAFAGQEATEVGVLPSVDALPWQDAVPHAEILETRAVTLWRYCVLPTLHFMRNRRDRWHAMKTSLWMSLSHTFAV